MREIWNLAIKDLRLLVRDRAGCFFTFFFPILFSIFFGTIFSGGGRAAERSLRLAIVDEDRSAGSAAFVALLKQEKNLRIEEYAQLSEAEEDVLGAKQVGYVRIPAGFGAARSAMIAGGQAKVELGIDPAKLMEAGMLKGVVTQVAFRGLSDAFTNPAAMRDQLAMGRTLIEPQLKDDAFGRSLRDLFGTLDRFNQELARRDAAATNDTPARSEGGFQFQPVAIESKDVVPPRTGPPSAYAISFPQGIIWGIMGAAAGFGVSLVSERNQGTLGRLRMTPLARWQILGGKAVACFLTTALVSVVLVLVAHLPPFNVRLASPVMTTLAVFSVSIAFVGIMMLLATIGKTEQAAGGIGWAVLMVFAMLGGAAVPLMFMPEWIQSLASISPIKWAIQALEGGIWRGWSMRQMALPVGILLGLGTAGFALGARTFDFGHRA